MDKFFCALCVFAVNFFLSALCMCWAKEDTMTTILLLYIFSGLLLMGLAVPLIQRKIAPNGWYGFRISRTLNDPAVLYRANAVAGRWLFATGLVTVIAAVVLALLPLSVDTYALSCTAVIGVMLFVTLIQSFRSL
ncbi:hypothetical protein GC175_04315 [bacterium]|nr:hypothetical protein [bacterium]